MDVWKKNQYVILLLILIIFVSLSFLLILKIPFREGATSCLPNCDSVSFDTTTGEMPPCKELEEQSLQKKDAEIMRKQCVDSFTRNIGDLIKNKYNYEVLYNSLYDKKNRNNLNSYFTMDASSTTIQDFMDKMADNIDLLRANNTFKQNSTVLENYITRYKTDREIPSSDIKQKYDEYISCIEAQCKDIANRCNNNYNDQKLMDLIKIVKDNPSYYGLNSSFHDLRLYIKNSEDEESDYEL
jgi:hypothetical protein